MNEAHVNQLLELLTIRDRKIELQAKEIELLKKLLALNKPPEIEPEDLEPNKYPKAVEIEPSWFTDPAVDRAELETDEYPKYDELTRKE